MKATTARRDRLSVPRARRIVKRDEQAAMRMSLQGLPDAAVRVALRDLHERAADLVGNHSDEVRWHGTLLAVQKWATVAATCGVNVEVLAYTRKLCAELSRHPYLAPCRDNQVFPIDIGLAMLYNALQRYLVALERVLGKGADFPTGAP